MEEHLAEGALYAAGKSGKVNVHFTVSTEHRELFKKLVTEKVDDFAKRYGVDYYITFSEQKPSTDTIAADMDNQPFRDNGKLLFRPGGHGALIENLNDLDADIIFIKNIDNVVPDRLKADTVTYKKLIAGVLVTSAKTSIRIPHAARQRQIYARPDDGNASIPAKETLLQESEKQRSRRLRTGHLPQKQVQPSDACLRNGEERRRTGGGPFLAYNSDGTISLQILESSQIDMDDPEKKEMFEKGTHFNPVDLVCAVRDYKGHKFDLVKYVDKATGFISYKSKNGKDLKALELPGLWNGAMSDWNTVFVEVPLSTFNPVKTVNDLLREQHQ